MANMEISVATGVNDGTSTEVQGKQIRLETTRPEPIIEHIVPEKWFCLVAKSKKYRDYGETEVQMFINFEWSERIGDPSTELVCAHSGPDHHHDHEPHAHLPTTGTERPGEHHYHVPYVLDRVYKSRETTIFDFVVGRKAMRWARKQSEFLNVLVMTAVEALEETYSEIVDRDSLTVSSSIDYKLAPDFEVPSPSTPSASSADQGLMPYFERKLSSLSGAERMPQAKTGLTALQREMLLAHLVLPQSTPFRFMKLSIESSFHPTLKMTIPSFSVLQNERNVTLQVSLPLLTSSIKWRLFHSSVTQESDLASEAPKSDVVASERKTLPISVFELFCDHDAARHALCLPLFAKIDILQSYGTAGNQKAVFVLRKESVASWPSIIAPHHAKLSESS